MIQSEFSVTNLLSSGVTGLLQGFECLPCSWDDEKQKVSDSKKKTKKNN